MLRHLSMLVCLASAGAMLSASPSRAAVAYDESVSGDLSNDRSQPTPVSLSVGTNSLIASMGFLNDSQDLDYLRINLPNNSQMTGILLEKFDSMDETGFIGIQPGTTFTVDPDLAFAENGELLGWTHFGPGNGDVIGKDILPHLGAGFGAIGFTGPLSGSTYSFWIQQTGAPTDYQLDFIVAAV